MPWVVIDMIEDMDEIHVIPVCQGGHIIRPHIPSYECECKPEFEHQQQHLLVLHNDMIGNADANNFH